MVKFCFLNQIQTFCLKRNQSSLRKKIGWRTFVLILTTLAAIYDQLYLIKKTQ